MVNAVPRREDRPQSRPLGLEKLAIRNVQLAWVGYVFVYCYIGVISKKIGNPTSMVLVPVCKKDMGDRDIVVFEIPRYIPCPLRSSLLPLVMAIRIYKRMNSGECLYSGSSSYLSSVDQYSTASSTD